MIRQPGSANQENLAILRSPFGNDLAHAEGATSFASLAPGARRQHDAEITFLSSRAGGWHVERDPGALKSPHYRREAARYSERWPAPSQCPPSLGNATSRHERSDQKPAGELP